METYIHEKWDRHTSYKNYSVSILRRPSFLTFPCLLLSRAGQPTTPPCRHEETEQVQRLV